MRNRDLFILLIGENLTSLLLSEEHAYWDLFILLLGPFYPTPTVFLPAWVDTKMSESTASRLELIDIDLVLVDQLPKYSPVLVRRLRRASYVALMAFQQPADKARLEFGDSFRLGLLKAFRVGRLARAGQVDLRSLDCQKRLALAHELLESQFSFQRLRERVLWPGPFQRPPEPREDVNGLQRRGNEILDADLEQPHYFFRCARLQHGEDRNVH